MLAPCPSATHLLKSMIIHQCVMHYDNDDDDVIHARTMLLEGRWLIHSSLPSAMF